MLEVGDGFGYGGTTIAEAAGYAREAGDPDLLARTALGFRGPLRLMANDPREIDLLEEALAEVGESDIPTRAHLTAQLSLALPDIDPRGNLLAGAPEPAQDGDIATAKRQRGEGVFSRRHCLLCVVAGLCERTKNIHR